MMTLLTIRAESSIGLKTSFVTTIKQQKSAMLFPIHKMTVLNTVQKSLLCRPTSSLPVMRQFGHKELQLCINISIKTGHSEMERLIP